MGGVDFRMTDRMCNDVRQLPSPAAMKAFHSSAHAARAAWTRNVMLDLRQGKAKPTLRRRRIGCTIGLWCRYRDQVRD